VASTVSRNRIALLGRVGSWRAGGLGEEADELRERVGCSGGAGGVQLAHGQDASAVRLSAAGAHGHVYGVGQLEVGKQLFGRPCRLALALWIIRRDKPRFYQSEPPRGIILRGNLGSELGRLVRLGMLDEGRQCRW
jgi:hypothetical protein